MLFRSDRFDRRLYIIACQFWMMAVAATLAVLAFLGRLDHWNLLALSFCMGLGNAMNAPAWHAVVPEIVSGPLLRPAIALNSAGFNLAGYRDRDFAADRYTRAGPYVTMRLKFDQGSIARAGRAVLGSR